MSEAHFSLKFHGPAIENGEIDVNDLAPALLAVGNLIQAANSTINGDRAKASVKVRATAEGSFEVAFTLLTIIEAAKTILDFAETNKEGIAAANGLADLIFKVGGGVGASAGGLFFLLQWLRGKKPDDIEEKGGDVILHIGDNHFITNKNTIRLAEDIAVREQAKNLVSVLQREGIESISATHGENPELRLDRRDIRSFEIPETEEEEEEELLDEERRMNLQIISLTFKEDNKWRFTDGAEPFNASIEDVEFLNKIATNQVSFAKNDYLVCDVREHQVRTSKGLKKERIITRVVEHKPAPRQLRLM